MAFGAVPHSGNECSGLCATPCVHEDCWQCDKARSDARDKAQAKRILALETEVAKARRKANENAQSVLSAVPAQRAKDTQKAVITRGALEELARKAGVRMSWNDGEPVFYDDDVNESERRYNAAGRAITEEEVRRLKRLADQQKAGVLSSQAARSLAQSAAQTADKMVSDIIKQKVNETLREDILENEKRVKQRMRDEGASDEDITAAEKLLGGMPPQEATLLPEKLQSSILTSAQLRTLMENMRHPFPQPTYVVHPDDWEVVTAMSKEVDVRLEHADQFRDRLRKLLGG